MSDAETGTRWYVVQGRVRAAERSLRDLGLEVMAPYQRIKVGRGKRRHDADVPLFGLYLFAAIDGERIDRWRRLLELPGVGGVLSTGEGEAERPFALPASVIDEVRARCTLVAADHGETLRWIYDYRMLAAGPRFAKGARIFITGGAFADHFGSFDSVDEKGRASVFMRIMGRLMPVRLNISLLESASVAGFSAG